MFPMHMLNQYGDQDSQSILPGFLCMYRRGIETRNIGVSLRSSNTGGVDNVIIPRLYVDVLFPGGVVT